MMSWRKTGLVLVLTIVSVAAFADFKAALVLNQRRGDLAAIDQMCSGLEQAQKELGIEIKIVESRDATEYEDNIRAMVDWGANIIFTSFEPLVKPALASATQNPNVKYALIYASIDNPPTNVLPITYNDVEASYLSGVVAATKTKSDKVAFTTGADIPSQRTAYDGFVKGVHSVKPAAKTFFAVIGSFEDPAKGKEVGLSMISQGVDVFCGWAAKSDFGIIEAAKENGKWVCGLSGVIDLRSRYPGAIISEVGVQFGKSIYETTKALYIGKTWAGGKTRYATMKTGDVAFTFAPSTQDGWTAKEADKLNSVARDILSGKLDISK